MTFKLKSQVSVYEHPKTGSNVEGVTHIVISRERRLYPGDIVKTTGSVATDIEAKGPWMNANVMIKVVDDKELEITWQEGWLSKWISRMLSNWLPDESQWITDEIAGYYDQEKIIAQEPDPLESLADPYHHIDTYNLPETFNLIDRLRAPYLTRAIERGIQGMRRVDRETKLLYEPTLPSQSRK